MQYPRTSSEEEHTFRGLGREERGDGTHENSRQSTSANLGRISGARQRAIGVGKFVRKRIQIRCAPAFAAVLEPREDVIRAAAAAFREAGLNCHAI